MSSFFCRYVSEGYKSFAEVTQGLKSSWAGYLPPKGKISVDVIPGSLLYSSVRIIRTDKQKDSLAKFFWDTAKVAFTLLVIAPFAKPESISALGLLIGSAIGIILGLWGYILDGMEVRL